ncbi:MipA/OmpV family protein [Enterobacter ludwigii]|uniref:MipA/OmpV family protein n=1 Tax=Enterobacter ludwigii TaxID=299767 RepID=UPI0039747128
MKEIKIALVTLIAASFASQASSDKKASYVTIGVGSQYAPEYTGSNKYDVNTLPYFGWTYDDWSVNTDKGIVYSHQFSNGVYLGQALGYSLGRTDSGNTWLQEGSDKLKGMGKINTVMNTTTTAGWWMAPWIGFEGNITAPLTESQGMQYKIKLNVVLFANDTDTLLISTERKYGDARYNNTWFGVNENQSTHSGYRSFNAGSGLNSVNYDINWQHTFNDNWSGYADLGYITLADRVSSSPIVQKDEYLLFTVGAFYTF